MKTTLQDLSVSASGMATSWATALVLLLLERVLGVALYTYMLWFFLPVGAGVAGFAGASGYYWAAKWLGRPPTRNALAGILLASVSTFFLVHYLHYYTAGVAGVAIRHHIPFLHYLRATLSRSELTFSAAGVPLFSSGSIGPGWSYVLAAAQVAGFAIGGAVVFHRLRKTPYCRACFKYLSRIDDQQRFEQNESALLESTTTVRASLEAGNLQHAIDAHSSTSGVPSLANDSWRSIIELWRCSACAGSWLSFVAERLVREDLWAPLPDTRFETFTREHLVFPWEREA